MPEHLPAKHERRSDAALNRSPKNSVGGRLKKAIDAMVWTNATDSEAATQFKISVTAIRLALKKPHVRLYLKEQREVLHARELARNSHALIAVRDQTGNPMARVAAVRQLEHVVEAESAHPHVTTPGICIQIIDAAPRPPGAEPKTIKILPARARGDE